MCLSVLLSFEGLEPMGGDAKYRYTAWFRRRRDRPSGSRGGLALGFCHVFPLDREERLENKQHKHRRDESDGMMELCWSENGAAGTVYFNRRRAPTGNQPRRRRSTYLDCGVESAVKGDQETARRGCLGLRRSSCLRTAVMIPPLIPHRKHVVTQVQPERP